MKRRGVFSILVAVLIVAVLLLFLISFQVRINEQAIVFTFGRAGRVIDQPGLYWRLPYPVQTFKRYDTRLSVLEGKYSECLTQDQHTLIVTLATGWRIRDARVFYESVGTVKNARNRLNGLVEGAARKKINEHELAHFISVDPEQFRYHEIENEILAAVHDEARKTYGIDTQFVYVTKLAFPEDVTKQVLPRIREERQRKAKAIRAEGAREAQTIVSDAERDKSKILSEAHAEATRIRGEGDSAATEYYAQLAKNPELAVFLRELEALRRVSARGTFVITTDEWIFRLLSPRFAIPGSRAAPGGRAAAAKDPKPQKGK